jgi:hypothetical protein
MSYTWEVSISWGSGTAPDTIKINDSTGDHTATIVTAIAETGAGSGVYTSRITANVFGKDYWSIGSGQASPGDDLGSLRNLSPQVLFDGVTSGGSTTTEIYLIDPWSQVKAASYIGSYAVIANEKGRILAYTDRGSGVASVTVPTGSFASAPSSSVSVQVIKSGAPVQPPRIF